MTTHISNTTDNNRVDVQSRTEMSYDSSEQWPPVCSVIKRNMRRAYTNRKKNVMNRLPVLKWLPEYRANYLFFDFIAGLTVGLTAIPQGIAYAIVAGLPPAYGLYSGFAGAFVYLVFGSVKDVTIGPTAILALLIQKYVSESSDFAVFLTFVNGAMVTIFGMLNLGFLVQFISVPVTIGFTMAASMTIGSGQVKPLLGIKGASNGFIESLVSVFKHITDIQLWDTILGFSTIIVLYLLKSLKYKKSVSENESLWKNEFKKYLSLGRNAIVVIIGTVLAYVLDVYGKNPFTLTGQVASGLPEFKLPPFQTTIKGSNETLYFTDMVVHVGSSIIPLSLVSILESMAICKAITKGRSIDATQEMLALGMCNLFGSFFQSMPVTGSLTRTVVNNASGVRTPLGGIMNGCLDVIPFICTLIACLSYSIEYGIVFGIAINVGFTLYNIARPKIHAQTHKIMDREFLVLVPDQSLTFSSSDHFTNKVLKNVTHGTADVVIIDGKFVLAIDATVAKSISTVVDDLHLLNKKVYFWNWGKAPMGVLCRLNPKLFPLFKIAQTQNELMETMTVENGKPDTTISI